MTLMLTEFEYNIWADPSQSWPARIAIQIVGQQRMHIIALLNGSLHNASCVRILKVLTEDTNPYDVELLSNMDHESSEPQAPVNTRASDKMSDSQAISSGDPWKMSEALQRSNDTLRILLGEIASTWGDHIAEFLEMTLAPGTPIQSPKIERVRADLHRFDSLMTEAAKETLF